MSLVSSCRSIGQHRGTVEEAVVAMCFLAGNVRSSKEAKCCLEPRHDPFLDNKKKQQRYFWVVGG